MKPIVIANWKMNETNQEADDLLDKITPGLGSLLARIDVVICPPFTALSELKKSPFLKGAQDIHWEDKGTFTGEVSGPMLRDLGCQYVIIGHSERRWQLGETEDVINKKLQGAIRNKLIPILCVGERRVDRDDGRQEDVLLHQLRSAWRGLGRQDCEKLIIAYEPVWAIGTGDIGSRQAATPDILTDAISVIQKFITQENLQGKAQVVYGGSVDAGNVNNFLQVENNTGFLVGGASLKPGEFVNIVTKVSQSHD